MKRYIVLSMLSFLSCISLGKEKTTKNPVHKFQPYWAKKAIWAAGSNYVETFAQAFNDPNVLIGVFERPREFSYTTLSSGEVLERFPGYFKELRRFRIRRLRCIKSIKGKFPEPVCLYPAEYPPRLERRPTIPPFIPSRGSKWVVAMKKTTKEFRISRFGEDIERCKFVSDRTTFELFKYGYGALCLKWPDDDKNFPKPPSFVVQVPESIVDDFESILRVLPHTQKEKIDPKGIVAINKTSKMLKTNAAKLIFAKILDNKLEKVQDPNDDE